MPLYVDDADEIGRLVRYHRERARLSREALATIAGVGKTVIFDVEHGKATVQFDTLRALLRALNIRVGFDSPLVGEFMAHGQTDDQADDQTGGSDREEA